VTNNTLLTGAEQHYNALQHYAARCNTQQLEHQTTPGVRFRACVCMCVYGVCMQLCVSHFCAGVRIRRVIHKIIVISSQHRRICFVYVVAWTACQRAYMHTCILARIHTFIHTYNHTYKHTYIPTYIHMYTYIYTCTYTHTNFIHLHIHTSSYIHTYMYVCIHQYFDT